MTRTIAPPPVTPFEPVTESLQGISISDPYRWLEEQNSSRTRKWLKEQTAYARLYLDTIPGRERIRKRVQELLEVEVVSEPWKVGRRCFYLKRQAYQEQAVIMMRECDAAEEAILLDPATKGEGSATFIRIVNISQDGNILAYAVKRNGT